MAEPIYISHEGLEKLKKDLEELKNVKRKEIIKRIEIAKDMGDLSENAEYTDAKDEQAFIEGKILDMEDTINNAIVLDEKKKTGSVDIGSTITVTADGGQREFTIVGASESIPEKGLISNESPLGRAFLGRREGDEVEVTVPKGKIIYKISRIQ
jgi:transcription elongation factor GreA